MSTLRASEEAGQQSRTENLLHGLTDALYWVSAEGNEYVDFSAAESC